MAKKDHSNSDNKRPKQVGKHQWNFHKFLKYLDDHQAEVKIKHTSGVNGETSVITYSHRKGDLSLRQLVFDACGFDKMSQVYTYTRTQALNDKVTRGEELREGHMDIIESVHLDFTGQEVYARARADHLEKFKITKSDLYVRVHPRKPKDDYDFFNHESSILDVYPDFGREIHQWVNRASDNLLDQEIDFVPREFAESFSIGQVIQKAYEHFKTHKLWKADPFIQRFEQLTKKYREIYASNSETYSNAVLPEYSNFACLFEDTQLGDEEYWWVGSIIAQPLLDLQTAVVDPNINLVEPKYWFSGYRYQLVRETIPELLNLEVEEWPDYYFEHAILMGLEYAAVESVLINTVIAEVLNCRLRVFYSKDGTHLTVDHTNISIEEFSTLLLSYNILPDLDGLVEVKAGQVIPGPIKRYPSHEVKSNSLTASEISGFIRAQIANYLIRRLCKYVKFQPSRFYTIF